ncbi:DUF4245 domain-containing protein [Nocardioides piscis]|uniref:DUF4245 domain-containing protein n=1 Tax=Nocardioides piscis TaxID=2714938 RepID=A0A6G7YBY4_9ACTN|nr:DUF4245 domain-containing protein [Nocardioides piscis]QIK74186.1 DUF4245 domain-containing protein [Nocardioides piscis]
MSEKPGRYQRSATGMIGAMLVTLLAIGAFVLLRSLVRADVEVEPEPVDYAAAADAAREAGFGVVAPASLPSGWTATSIEFSQIDPQLWRLGMLTDDGKFVGVRQEDESVSELVDLNIDEDAVEGEPLRLPSVVGDTWTTWTDEGGDTGYSIEYGDETVLVYGSAPAEDLRELISRLEK